MPVGFLFVFERFPADLYSVGVYLESTYVLLGCAHASVIAIEVKVLKVGVLGDCFADDRQAFTGEFGITFSFSPLFKKLVIVFCLNESELLSFNRADFLHVYADFGVGHCKDNCSVGVGQVEVYVLYVKTRL